MGRSLQNWNHLDSLISDGHRAQHDEQAFISLAKNLTDIGIGDRLLGERFLNQIITLGKNTVHDLFQTPVLNSMIEDQVNATYNLVIPIIMTK